jgi:uncharacterized membrane protein
VYKKNVNRTRELPAYIVVLQMTVPPRAADYSLIQLRIIELLWNNKLEKT